MWAEIDVEMIILLKKSSSMQDMIIRFKIKFLEQFSEFFVETESVFFYTEISELKQNKNEFLLIYYKQVVIMMKKINARNQARSVISEQSISMSNFLNNFESAILNIILEIFIWKIADEKIKQAVLKYMMTADKSLLKVYMIIKETYKTKTRMIKFRKKERKIWNLEFYKKLIQ